MAQQETFNILKDMLGLDTAVSFREFVSSPDYCNCQDLYEYWYKQDESINDTVTELILTGSLGGGKSLYAAYRLAYRVYLLFLSGNPQKQLGLAENTDIFCFYFSVSMTQAKRSGYQYIYNIFDTCKWFNENAPINKNLKSSIEFVDRHFYIAYASSEGAQIGLNVWGAILDEGNFFSGVGTGVELQYEEVTQLYNQILDRQLSRYARPDGSVNAFDILISSASYQSSFVEKRIASIKDDKTKCIRSRAYETNPSKFSKETFEVFIGAGTCEPQIIQSEEHKQRLLQVAGILGTGEEEKFIEKVPVNLKPAFLRNILLAIQNHCGIPTNLSSSFMSNLKFLYDSYVDDIPQIFQSEYLEASSGDDTKIIEYLLPEFIQFSDRPHSIFIDASLANDTAAIVCHRYDGRNEKNEDIHTKVFALKLKPPAFPHKTKLSKIQNFVIDIASYINLVAVGSDQYQSAEMRQEINSELGLEDIRISIDSSDVPHMLWQRALVEHRIRQTQDKLLEKEIKEAVHDWKKHRVLKAQGSSDDTMQATVGSFYLSDTIGKQSGTCEGLYPGGLNLVGARKLEKFLKQTGYKTN